MRTDITDRLTYYQSIISAMRVYPTYADVLYSSGTMRRLDTRLEHIGYLAGACLAHFLKTLG